MKIIFSIDDGDKEDLKVADILQKAKIQAIFFIPSNCKLNEEDIKSISDKGFIIGAHTVSHPQDMKLLQEKDLVSELEDNRRWLQEITGQKVEHFCYPRGRYNEETIKAVKNAGFKYARTTLVGNIIEPEFDECYRIQTSVHCYPNRVEYNGQKWLDYAIMKLEGADNSNGYFHVWLHSWELTKWDLWNDFKKLVRKINEYKFESAEY